MGSGSSDGTNPADDVRAPAKPVPHEEVEEGIDPFAEDTASEDEDHSSVPSGGRGATPRESQPAHAGPEPEPESLLEMREQITMLQAQLDALKGQVEVRVRGWEGGESQGGELRPGCPGLSPGLGCAYRTCARARCWCYPPLLLSRRPAARRRATRAP